MSCLLWLEAVRNRRIVGLDRGEIARTFQHYATLGIMPTGLKLSRLMAAIKLQRRNVLQELSVTGLPEVGVVPRFAVSPLPVNNG